MATVPQGTSDANMEGQPSVEATWDLSRADLFIHKILSGDEAHKNMLLNNLRDGQMNDSLIEIYYSTLAGGHLERSKAKQSGQNY